MESVTEQSSEQLVMEAAVGARQVNVYVEEGLEDLERTVCIVYYVGQKGIYKHFTYVLAPGKTRITLSDLITGAYEVHGIQMSHSGEKLEGRIRFDYTESTFDLIDYSEDVLDSLERIERSVRARRESREE